MRPFADYHTHTVHSHGTGTVEDNVLAALDRGLSAVGIADHGPSHIGIGIPELGTLSLIKAETEQYTRQLPIKVLAGVEANIVDVDGTLDVPAQDLRRLDIRLAGLHWQVWPRSWKGAGMLLGNVLLRRRGTRAYRRRLRNINTKATVEAVRRFDLDILTHPGLQADIDTAELARACAARGTAMEVSAGHQYITPEYVRLCLREGSNLVLSSDAHQPAKVGDLEVAVRLVERAGAPVERIVNVQGYRDSRGDRDSSETRRIPKAWRGPNTNIPPIPAGRSRRPPG